MAKSPTIEAPATTDAVEPDAPVEAEAATGFGSEYRDLARQRRFVRSETPEPLVETPAEETAWQRAMAVTRSAASELPAAPRISDDQRAVLTQLSIMSDRLVEAREQLARTTARAEHAEAGLAASQQQMMAARMLVLEAQRTTRELSERCAGLEARCETLDEALHVAVHSTMLSRWKWRRQMRANTGA